MSKAIAADPRHLSGKRLYEFIRELDFEDVPWDDANVQDYAGSVRIYHFRGFRLTVIRWRLAPAKMLKQIAAVSPPWSLPTNNQFFLLIAQSRNVRSTVLLSISGRPSSG
jgi:hypothetical protein